MRPYKVTVEFVTPCFLGGADSTTTAEWRAASIRGQLRWWFRAIVAHRVAYDVEKLLKLEEATWGSTSQRSRLRLRCAPLPPSAIETAHETFESTKTGHGKDTMNGPAYLGYGPIGRENRQFRNLRPFIKPGTMITFEVETRAGIIDDTVCAAVQAWACFGGLGARSRRGFGSVSVTSNDRSFEAATVARDLQSALGLSFGSWSSLDWQRFPPFSAFSNGTRVLVWKEPQDGWAQALQKIGEELITYRRRYKAPSSAGVAPTRDYVWAYDPHDETSIPDRIGFGLPLAFGVKGDATHRKKVVLVGESHERRASPLLIHIAKAPDGFRPVLLYMPAVFLPNNEKVVYGGDEGRRGTGAVEGRHFAVVEEFLAGLKEKALVEEVH